MEPMHVWQRKPEGMCYQGLAPATYFTARGLILKLIGISKSGYVYDVRDRRTDTSVYIMKQVLSNI